MSLDSGEVRVFGSQHLYTAPVGTAFPDDIDDPIDTDDWIELGYTSPEGPRFSFGREIYRVMSSQSFDPLRLVITALPKTVSADLLQWNGENLPLALGGGTVTEPTPGAFLYEPPDESEVDERALIVEGVDGDYTYRFCYRKSVNEAGVEFAFVRESESRFPVTMTILAADDEEKPFLIQTDDPAIASAVGS